MAMATSTEWTRRRGQTFTKDKVFRIRIDIDLLINRENNLRFFAAVGVVVGWRWVPVPFNWVTRDSQWQRAFELYLLESVFVVWQNSFLISFPAISKNGAETKRGGGKMVDFTPAVEEVKNKICLKWKIGLCKCERWLCTVNSLNKLCAAESRIESSDHIHNNSRRHTHTRYFSTAMSFISFWFYLSLVENMCFNTDGEYCAANGLSVRHAKQINSVSGETHVERAARMRIWCRSICPIARFGHSHSLYCGYGSSICGAVAVYRHTK